MDRIGESSDQLGGEMRPRGDKVKKGLWDE